jgi:hypothetical protein
MSSTSSTQGETRNDTEFWSDSLKERDYLEDLGGGMIEPETEGQDSAGF